MNVFNYFFETTQDLEKDFVLGSKETVSFKALYQNSLSIASYIKENIGENKNIILRSPNSVFFITVYLGILKSGNVCVPIDYAIEQDNLNYILKTTASIVVFTKKNIPTGLIFNDEPQIIDEDMFNEIIERKKMSNFNRIFDNNRVAEIIFTSGSTGEPKGVEISHLNIISNTDSIVEYLKLTSKDIVSVVMPFFYCYGLSLLHTHLKVGGSVVLNNTFMFLGSVIQDLKKFRCTGFAGVPSHFQILLKKSKNFKKTKFPDLRYVTQAGGKLHNVFIQEFVETFPNINFIVMYGQTEATARLSFLPPNLVLSKLGSIGRAIPGVILKVVNKKGNEVPIGEVGEIVAKGDNIMKGYYKDADGTKSTIKKA